MTLSNVGLLSVQNRL